MHRLVCTFVVRIWLKQVFSWHGSNNTLVWAGVPHELVVLYYLIVNVQFFWVTVWTHPDQTACISHSLLSVPTKETFCLKVVNLDTLTQYTSLKMISCILVYMWYKTINVYCPVILFSLFYSCFPIQKILYFPNFFHFFPNLMIQVANKTGLYSKRRDG